MESYKLALLFALCITLSYAKVDAGSDTNSVNPSEKTANSTAAAEKQPYPVQNSSYFPADLSWKTGFGQALIFVGAAAFSVALLGGLVLLFAPVFGYRVCTVLGNCEPIATTYTTNNLQSGAQAQPNAYDVYGNNYLAANPYVNYQKRSIEYIKPILETLAKTYEKSS